MATNKPRISNSSKFLLLLWKNWILQWHHKWALFTEVFLPVILIMLFVLLRMALAPTQIGKVIFEEQLAIDNLSVMKENLQHAVKYNVVFAPITCTICMEIVKEAAASLALTYQGLANSAELESKAIDEEALAAIDFGDSMAQTTEYPKKLSYKLRLSGTLKTSSQDLDTWITDRQFMPLEEIGPRNEKDADGGIPVGYLREGFLPLQNAISTAFITQSSKKQGLPKVYLQRFPHPPYIADILLPALTIMLPMTIALCYLYPCMCRVQYITAEKEKQLKEVMKIMGLQNWLHWSAWFVQSFITMGLSSVLITVVLVAELTKNGAVLRYSSFMPVLFFLLIYTITIITFCFMLATFFSKASTAATLTGVILFFMFFPYVMAAASGGTSSGAKMWLSLICNCALGFGCEFICTLDIRGRGLHWDNMFKDLSVDEDISLGHIILMMLVSCVIHMIICLYMEQVYPGDFGVAKVWYFPFTESFWFGDREEIDKKNIKNERGKLDPDAFEADPIGNVGVQVKNLVKKFGGKTVVNNLSLNMYEDEITVLLGHNGAGKTTTIAILTGMFSPTLGTAIINGFDIRTNIDDARMSMGFCPQHNVLFDDLTVKQHIIFYSRLKGLKGRKLEAEVQKYIKKIGLVNKANLASSKLSGGMKRKLSLCTAFCGGTKVVLCDEPSSGMDPLARRELWDFMQSEKNGRSVLLTTHFMDEADVLGDRIAIMSGGVLQCVGTPFFLKKKFGSGYHLVCVKEKDCNSTEVTNVLRKYIPNIQPEAEIGSELSYRLPEIYSSRFPMMFQDLESNFERLRLNGFGVAVASLEEVFLKVGAEVPEGGGSAQNPRSSRRESGSVGEESIDFQNIFADNQHSLKGKDLLRSQWRSMILKKYLHTTRSKFVLAFQIMYPLLTMIWALSGPDAGISYIQKPMRLELSNFPETVTVLETTSKVQDGSIEAQISKNFKNVVNSFGSAHKLAETGNTNFIDYILKLGETNQPGIDAKFIAAATVDNGKVIAWLNNKPLHSAPLTLNLIHNAMARTFIGPEASITITNHPLPFSKGAHFKLLNDSQNAGAFVGSRFCSCLFFTTPLYIKFVIDERNSRAKLLQFVSGVRVFTFWLSHLVWDYLTYVISILIVIVLISFYQVEGYSTFGEIARVTLLLMLFGLSTLTFIYLVEGYFLESAPAIARLIIFGIFIGQSLELAMRSLKSLSIYKLHSLFCVFPPYALSSGLNELYVNTAKKKICKSLMETLDDATACQLFPFCCEDISYFAWEEPGVLSHLVYFLATSVVFFIILIAVEYRLMDSFLTQIRAKKQMSMRPAEDLYYDEDVEEEKEIVKRMLEWEIAEKNLVLDRVTKFYGNFRAVNQISLVVRESQCFGLLGINGAGKTTTFKMLTGDEKMTSGEAYVKGISLRRDMHRVYQEIGYCPQFDALFNEFTGRETLKIYSLLRGIPEDRIPNISADLAKNFGFMKHYDKQSHTYSGGNKRKLSTAIAVLGGPSVVYLDEPTSGMDPGARRQLWNVICKVRDAGKSVILTSHGMDECEALCTRLAIMVNGEFKCIGSIQYLKNKFTKGLILKVKIKRDEVVKNESISQKQRKQMRAEAEKRLEEDVDRINNFMQNEFPQAYLKERFEAILTYYIPLIGVSWSKIFGLIEAQKVYLNIEDYAISQTTLEEIFLQFANSQG